MRSGLPGRTQAHQGVALSALYLKKHCPEHHRAACVRHALAHCWRFAKLPAQSSDLSCIKSVNEFPLSMCCSFAPEACSYVILIPRYMPPEAGRQLYFYISGMLLHSAATCTSPMTQELHPDKFLTLFHMKLCVFVTCLEHFSVIPNWRAATRERERVNLPTSSRKG